MEKTYLLYLNTRDVLIGRLFVSFDQGSEVCSFSYDKDFISKHPGFFLDPDIEPYLGRQFPKQKNFFGFISDLMPDRWGRNLIERNERNRSKEANAKPRKLTELDYLLNVEDVTRSGAIRICEEGSNIFLASSNNIPPFISLRKLEQASLDYEDDFNNDELIQMLLLPGSSLGGARPKANVYSNTNEDIYIAKFPSKKDDIDVGLWEKVVSDLASMCEINVSDSILEEKKNKYGSIFLTKRFDREGNNRIHYSSTMTLLNAIDGENKKSSYLDIFHLIKTISKKSQKDSFELFKRVIFSICVNNCDDHLRNHGFLCRNENWELSPMFDVNISLDTNEHSLNFVDNNLNDFSNVYEIGKYLGYSKEMIENEIMRIKSIVENNLDKIAKRYNASKSEIKLVKNVLSQFSSLHFANN